MTDEERARLRQAERLAKKEAALREVMHALGAALTAGEVIRQVADSAVSLTAALGAYVEWFETPESSGEVEVVAIAGQGVPPLGTRVPYPGSLTEAIVESGLPAVMAEVGTIGESMAPYLRNSCRRCSALVVPLMSEGRLLGSLVLIRSAGQRAFDEDEKTFIRALGDSASAALRRTMLLEEIDRQRLERTALLQSTGEGIYGIDRDGNCTFINRAGAELLGYAREEVLGRRMHDLIHHSHADGRPYPYDACPIVRATRTGEDARMEGEVFWRKDGTTLPVEYSSAPIREEVGIVGAVVAFRDTTQRVHAEMLVRARARQQEAVAVLGQHALAGIDLDTLMDEAVHLVADRLGVEYAKVLELLPDGHAMLLRSGVGWKEGMVGHATVGTGLDSQAGYTLVSTEPVLVEDLRAETRFSGPALLRDHGVVSGMSVIIQGRDRPWGVLGAHTRRRVAFTRDDLSFLQAVANVLGQAIQRKRFEEERERILAREREARGEAERRAMEEAALREATAAVSTSFTVEDTVRQIAAGALIATRADGAFVEQIDEETSETVVVATAGGDVPPLGERLTYRTAHTRRAAEANQAIVVPRLTESDLPLIDHLKRQFPDHSALFIPLVDEGEAIGSLVLLRSPAKQRFRPDELKRALTFGNLAALAFRRIHLLEESERRREELEMVTESRARLMRGFSHDLKNPLGAADGQLQLMEMGAVGELSARQRQSVARARAAIRSAIGLIEDLLELARAEAGAVSINSAPTDVRQAVREIAGEYRAQAEAKGLRLDLMETKSLPVVESDAARIRQVLSNLLSNAVKYTVEGGIRIGVEPRRGGAAPGPGTWIAADVSDTGPGISPEHQRLLFREFSRLEPEEFAGAGVGLAISKRVAQALGGDVTVSSEPGRGSTFTLWLPAGREATVQVRRKAAD